MDTENETPPHPQSIKLLSFPNGKPHNHPPQLPHTAVTYRECLKNHAAGIGGHAVDGCGEFMPSPTEPTSFQCAACSCHRNFHRREHTTTTATRTHFIDFHRTSTSTSPSPPSPPPKPTNYAFGQNLILSLNAAADHNNHQVATPGTPLAIKISGRKRFRTKFSQDQKDKMLVFAEKVGWKMQRCDDKLVAEFCNQIGIRRRIFKVWMHNNKNTLAKKDSTAVTTTVISTANITATHQENGRDSSSSS